VSNAIACRALLFPAQSAGTTLLGSANALSELLLVQRNVVNGLATVHSARLVVSQCQEVGGVIRARVTADCDSLGLRLFSPNPPFLYLATGLPLNPPTLKPHTHRLACFSKRASCTMRCCCWKE
jgi:hypothetical protein